MDAESVCLTEKIRSLQMSLRQLVREDLFPISEVSEVMTVREWCDLYGEPYGAGIRAYELAHQAQTRWILRAPFIPIIGIMRVGPRESTGLLQARRFKIEHPLQGGWEE